MTGQNMNIARLILKRLYDQGIRTLCLCPGARNAPFVSLLSQSTGFEIVSFFDERSAGFFALGRIKRDKKPVAVLTTSGTAVSELLSSVIEAHYSSLPLVVVSADRPVQLRSTGAPQTIDQTNLFKGYVDQSWDITTSSQCDIVVSIKKPVHLNVCFNEPLIDQTFSEIINFSEGLSVLNHPKNQTEQKTFDRFLKDNEIQMDRPLIVLSGLDDIEAENVAQWLENYKGLVYAEALSRLKNHPVLKNKLIKGGERIVSRILSSGEVNCLIRIGDVPLGRFWRDVDRLDMPVISISSKEFSGSKNSLLYQTDLSQKLEKSKNLDQILQDYLNPKEDLSEPIKELAEKYPQSEAQLFLNLIDQIDEGDSIYVGNSLPVRWLDLFDDKHSHIFASRGVNGIDGQLSTAFGLCKPHQRMWIILGDLTTLYDFSAFWLTSRLRDWSMKINLVVINNKGGQIFSRLFKEELFLNRHDQNFNKIAEMWDWNYQRSDDPMFLHSQQDLNIFELLPLETQTQNFWKEYDQLWKN